MKKITVKKHERTIAAEPDADDAKPSKKIPLKKTASGSAAGIATIKAISEPSSYERAPDGCTFVELRFGEKSKGKDPYPEPPSVRIPLENEMAAGLRVGQKVRIELEPV
jgi:hypothetical protein